VILSAHDLRVRFRKGIGRKPVDALAGLNLEVREGEFLGLIGANGAGKSTAMYCFLGLTHPTSGTVTVLGEPPRLGNPAWRAIAYLPEEPTYHQYLTVEEAVRFYATLAGAVATAAQISAILDRLGLAEFRRMRLSKCSKGMKQKVGIAQCLLHSPRLLFLDEPMRGLDPITVRQFREILADLHRQGATVVMSSHILPEVEALATRVAVVHRGRIVASDTVANLTRPAADAYDVECQAVDALPEFFADVVRNGAALTATIPADRLHDFMAFARDGGLTVHSCVLRRRSLEESFVSILTAAAHD
jgi:ABC-type multidrug transport system ATPase subunit